MSTSMIRFLLSMFFDGPCVSCCRFCCSIPRDFHSYLSLGLGLGYRLCVCFFLPTPPSTFHSCSYSPFVGHFLSSNLNCVCVSYSNVSCSGGVGGSLWVSARLLVFFIGRILVPCPRPTCATTESALVTWPH